MRLRFFEKNIFVYKTMNNVLYLHLIIYNRLYVLSSWLLHRFRKNDKNEVGFLFNGILLTAPYINCSIENGNFFIVTDRVRDSDCFNR